MSCKIYQVISYFFYVRPYRNHTYMSTYWLTISFKNVMTFLKGQFHSLHWIIKEDRLFKHLQGRLASVGEKSVFSRLFKYSSISWVWNTEFLNCRANTHWIKFRELWPIWVSSLYFLIHREKASRLLFKLQERYFPNKKENNQLISFKLREKIGVRLWMIL